MAGAASEASGPSAAAATDCRMDEFKAENNEMRLRVHYLESCLQEAKEEGEAAVQRAQAEALACRKRTDDDHRAEIQELRATVEELQQRLGEKDVKVLELQKQLELAVKPGEMHDRRQQNTLNGTSLALTPFSLGQLAALPEDRPRGDSLESLGHELFSAATSVSDGTNSHAAGGLSHMSSECVDTSYRGLGQSCSGTESVVVVLQSHIRAMEAQLTLTQIDQEELSVVRCRNTVLERQVQHLQEGIEVRRRPWYSGFMNNFCTASERSAMPTLPLDLEPAERSEPSPPAFSGLA